MATNKKAAAALVAAQYEPLVAQRYEGVENPTPTIKTTYRVRHNVVVDPKLKAINECMRSKLAGRVFSGGNKIQNIKEQREAFRKARKECST